MLSEALALLHFNFAYLLAKEEQGLAVKAAVEQGGGRHGRIVGSSG